MPIIVDIIIKGVAICYRKEVEGKSAWRVLFPFDEKIADQRCHNLYFNWRREDMPASRRIAMANPNVWIHIKAVGSTSDTAERENFGRYAFDLTSNTNYVTHQEIAAKENWANGTVLMTIDDAAFFSRDYIQDLTEEIPVLWEGEQTAGGVNVDFDRPQLPGVVTHSVRARIELVDDGELSVLSNALPRPIIIQESGNYTITFDNDCPTVTQGRNDMFMFYERTIEDVDNNAKMFWIGGTALEPVSEPPSLAEGKPCLIVKVSDPTSIRNLP